MQYKSLHNKSNILYTDTTPAIILSKSNYRSELQIKVNSNKNMDEYFLNEILNSF